ncbi:MAG: hypothetical protein ACW99U_12970 [Candidatus Thorarchaeota archaeon]|jgi:hypothetical protein
MPTSIVLSTWTKKKDQYTINEITGDDGRVYYKTLKNPELEEGNKNKKEYHQTFKRIGGVKFIACECRAWLFSESHGRKATDCPHSVALRKVLKRIRQAKYRKQAWQREMQRRRAMLEARRATLNRPRTQTSDVDW